MADLPLALLLCFILCTDYVTSQTDSNNAFSQNNLFLIAIGLVFVAVIALIVGVWVCFIYCIRQMNTEAKHDEEAIELSNRTGGKNSRSDVHRSNVHSTGSTEANNDLEYIDFTESDLILDIPDNQSQLSESPSYHTLDNNPRPRRDDNRATPTHNDEISSTSSTSSSSDDERHQSPVHTRRSARPLVTSKRKSPKNSRKISSSNPGCESRSNRESRISVHHQKRHQSPIRSQPPVRGQSPRHSEPPKRLASKSSLETTRRAADSSRESRSRDLRPRNRSPPEHHSHTQRKKRDNAPPVSKRRGTDHAPPPPPPSNRHSKQTRNAHHHHRSRETDSKPKRHSRSPPRHVHSSSRLKAAEPASEPSSDHELTPMLPRSSTTRRERQDREESFDSDTNMHYTDIFAAPLPKEQQYRMLHTFQNIPKSDVFGRQQRKREEYTHTVMHRTATATGLEDILETSSSEEEDETSSTSEESEVDILEQNMMKLPRIVTVPQQTPYRQMMHPLEYSQRYIPAHHAGSDSLPPHGPRTFPAETTEQFPHTDYAQRWPQYSTVV